MSDNRFFTNTYITGSGRQNYLRIDNLEDPLFTSFTLDIDYTTSPLFYTINYNDYGYPNVEGMGDKIKTALEDMYADNISQDKGYDILPLLSASILDGNKLGFGLQQNVYTDTPLYGATEYIYMVDRRNGGANQNDARFDSNRFVEQGGNPNELNSYKLGDSIKEIVNDSDKEWVERNKSLDDEQIKACEDIIGNGLDSKDPNYKAGDPDVINEHEANKDAFNTALNEYSNFKVMVSVREKDGEKYVEKKYELTEAELQQKLDECKTKTDSFEKFKRDIVSWANGELSKYQKQGTAIYTGNKCIQKIAMYHDISDSNKDEYIEKFKKEFGENFAAVMLFSGENSYAAKFNSLYDKIFKEFISKSGSTVSIKKEKVVEKFSNELTNFGIIKEGSDTFDGDIKVLENITPPDWALIFNSNASYFSSEDCKEVDEKIKSIMSYQCDFELSFDDKFTSDNIKNYDKEKVKYEKALDDIRTELYGFENGEICDKNNPSPDSRYGQYLKAKEILENDDYSQAQKALSMAKSGSREMSEMITKDDYNQSLANENYNAAIQKGEQPQNLSRSESIVASQTVLDMLGFINGMKKMTIQYPYIIQGVTGLDTAYNKHYGIKDPYLGSGEDKITLTCLESLDLRVSSMFNRYFNAVYDRQYRRERVPVNLRRFNCSIYVHDVRNFVAKSRFNKNGEYKVTYNRLLELTDMYFSVIEFRFFDCEIVPEETGNIFNDISNEAPSDMKKTNFTFTYGNCVVNFVPQSEVEAHNSSK
jgi:hypothetical protein